MPLVPKIHGDVVHLARHRWFTDHFEVMRTEDGSWLLQYKDPQKTRYDLDALLEYLRTLGEEIAALAEAVGEE